ncbi:MAG TPA: HemK/PrmC family methyltransferase [Acidimicrobiales bacterium]|nr:HemK/PrmC family methyltransferase [Acidimicrobiales bacterium]
MAAEEEADDLLASTSDASALEARLRRRESGEPLAWVTGRTRFCGHVIAVAPGVYVPRPHTEALARRAAAVLPTDGRALDLCTGSGAVAVHLMRERPLAHVVGVDIDERAAMCARSNGVPSVAGDAGAPPIRGPVDVVTMVAPYVPTRELRHLAADVQRYEPRVALAGGADGLDVVRRAILTCAPLLRPGGWFLTELGGDQDDALAPTLVTSGFETVATWRDDDGDLRGVTCRAR